MPETLQKSEKDVTSDKHNFIKQVLSNLYVFKCMDTQEFNLTVRGLAAFFKKVKGIGLVVIDGFHFMEGSDFLNQFDRKKEKTNANTADNQKKPTEFFDMDTEMFFSSNQTGP